MLSRFKPAVLSTLIRQATHRIMNVRNNIYNFRLLTFCSDVALWLGRKGFPHCDPPCPMVWGLAVIKRLRGERVEGWKASRQGGLSVKGLLQKGGLSGVNLFWPWLIFAVFCVQTFWAVSRSVCLLPFPSYLFYPPISSVSSVSPPASSASLQFSCLSEQCPR